MNYTNIIAKSFLFYNIPDEEIAEIIDFNDAIHNFPKGYCISNDKKFQKGISIVLNGTIHIKQGNVLLNVLNPSETFGVATIFTNEEYITDIFANTKSTILFITEEDLLKMFKENFQFTENYLSFLTSRVNFLNKKINSLTQGDARSKLIKYILNNCEENPNNPNQYLVTNFKSFSNLANILGIGRASLYRSLEELEQENLIKKAGKSIMVNNINQLKTNSEQ